MIAMSVEMTKHIHVINKYNYTSFCVPDVLISEFIFATGTRPPKLKAVEVHCKCSQMLHIPYQAHIHLHGTLNRAIADIRQASPARLRN